MQTLNISRKAALSFLSNLSFQDAISNSSKDKHISIDSKNSFESNQDESCSFSTDVENSDPIMDVPPDPDLDSIRIQPTISFNFSENSNRKPIRSKKDRVATSFLSNIELDSPELNETEKNSPIYEENDFAFDVELNGLQRSATFPAIRRKSESCSLGTDVLSSSSDSSSDEDLPYPVRVESYTEEEPLVQLGSLRKSSHTINVLTQSGSPQASHTSLRNSNPRAKTKKKSKALSKRNTDSYANLLSPKSTLKPDPPTEYNPLFLDDPSIQVETKSTGFSSIMDSLMQFAKSGESQNDFDDVFFKAHPSVDVSLNLSLIRSLKSKLLAIAQHLDFELASVAQAYAYFEKLCLKGLINKDNRKVKGACCLFLAIKINEHKSKLEGFMDAADRFLDVTEKEIRTTEFITFSELEFNLFIPISEFQSHMDRILVELKYPTLETYVGTNPFYSQLSDFTQTFS